MLTQLNLSSPFPHRVMAGAVSSREIIAHECAPREISNMFGWPFDSQILQIYLIRT